MDLHTVSSYRAAQARSDLRLSPGETVMGGGTWLFSEPQPTVSGLVDLTTLGWEPYETRADGTLRVGATCPIAALAEAPAEVLGRQASLVRACADALLMSFKVQQVATVGGNVCLALPAGAMTTLLAGLGAVAEVWAPDGGVRREPVADLVTGVRRTTLAPGEVVRAFEVPAASLAAPAAVRKLALTPIGRSSALVAGRVEDDEVVLTVTAATTRPVVLRVTTGDDLAEALAGVDCWYDDPHGPEDWRRAITARLAADVVADLERAA